MTRKTKDPEAGDLLTAGAPGEERRTATIATARVRPRLWISENRLAAAFDVADSAMERAEEQGEPMSADDYEALVGQYVNRDDALEERDFFVETVEDVEDLASLKMEQANRLLDQAAHLTKVAGRMRDIGVRVLEGRGVTELRGKVRILALKRSPGSVEVLDEAQIPEAFWTVSEDVELVTMRNLAAIAKRYLQQDIEDARAMRNTIRADDPTRKETEAALDAEILDRIAEVRQVDEWIAAAIDRRKRVDKMAIKAEWKEAGGHLRPARLEDLPAEVQEEQRAISERIAEEGGGPVDMVLAKRLREFSQVLVVPGATKVVTTKLVFK